jgi:hypothetical protein
MLDAASVVAADTGAAPSGVGGTGNPAATGAAGRSYFGASDMQPVKTMANVRGVTIFFMFSI